MEKHVRAAYREEVRQVWMGFASSREETSSSAHSTLVLVVLWKAADGVGRRGLCVSKETADQLAESERRQYGGGFTRTIPLVVCGGRFDNCHPALEVCVQRAARHRAKLASRPIHGNDAEGAYRRCHVSAVLGNTRPPLFPHSHDGIHGSNCSCMESRDGSRGSMYAWTLESSPCVAI
jgi:hypothetical protein